MPLIRTANLSDSQYLAELAENTFRDTFSSHNTVENMDAHCRSSYGMDVQAREISNPEYKTLVAEEDNRLVAYAQLRWGTPPDCVLATAPGEIYRLYVDKEWHGKGLAQELMSASLETMKMRGSDMIWLGVWENNPRAISFYRKFDFSEVGDHVFPVGRDLQRDIIMTRPARILD